MTITENHILFDFRGPPEIVGWQIDGDTFGYQDCRCVLRDGKAEISKPWFSVTPLFYSFQRGLLIISTGWLDLVGLLKKYGLDHIPDTDYLQSYLQYQCPFTGHTFCQQIRYLRGGESLSIRDGAVHTVFKDLEKDRHDYAAEAFRADIRRALADIDFQKTCFHLSSGLDSSILAILARGLCGKETLHAATCMTRGRGSTQELENIRRLSEDLKANLRIFDFSGIDIFEAGSAFIKGSLGYPIAHPSHLVEFLLDREISKQWDCIVTGRGPDECLAGFEWHGDQFSDPALHRDRMTVTPSSLLSKMLKPKNLTRFESNNDYWIPYRILSLKDRLTYELLTLSEAWNIITEAISCRFDINILSPFLHKKIRSGMFFLPDGAKLDSGNGKAFMKSTFRDLYPDYIREFPKQGLRLDLKPYLDDYSCEEILDKLHAGSSFLEAYFNVSEVKNLIVQTRENVRNYGYQIWSIYLLSLSAGILQSK